MKLSSRDILDILRRFELAADDNIPRQIEAIKISHPHTLSTLASFKFNRHLFYALFDEAVNDDIEYALTQIKTAKSSLMGEFIQNPKENSIKTHGLPYHGKDCYLFEVNTHKKRLDLELAERYPETSRSAWQKFIAAGYVNVNGETVTSQKLEVFETDSIEINIPAQNDYKENSLPIVYVDDNVIAINKPAGILSHAKGALTEEFTVADFFKRYSSYNSETNRPGIVHRLDRDTSGIMMGARNSETATMIQKQFADRKTKKTYLAIVVGQPKLDKANIDLPIERNPTAPSTFRVGSNGKSALTHYEVLATNDKYSLVKLQPKTGRTHQLRVHMKYINTPILGDRVYGKAAERLFLHAYSLEITIPISNRKTFFAPIPDEFLNYFSDIKL
jgi:23S rRNA pseudouridine1911/1915/1917 synthase